jgi:UDP-N-acetylglucosamine--N-acetylmuramyl-(pentapeptide) pyrophosphoryl-undecaprenol N-acetylglucosamine transferase
MSVTRHFVLAAGGTGGHMMPAHALAQELMQRGHHVALVTDERGARIPGLFAGAQTHVLPAGRLSGGPLGWMRAGRAIMAGRDMARRLHEVFQPSAVIGFGGYPALPALLAAFKDGIPTAIHEQNAVLGRVNRLVARKVDVIATAYPVIQRLKPRHEEKVALVGNPVRDAVLRLREEPFPAITPEGIFRLLITGGSQGASILSEVVPEALALLPLTFRRRLQVTQQCRAEDIEAVRSKYARLGIPADLATYFTDMPEKLAWSHLVIARAGASTIADITCAPRPASQRHRRPPDRQCARACRRRGRAGDPAAQVRCGRACQADAEARARSRCAQECRTPIVELRPPLRHPRPRRHHRESRSHTNTGAAYPEHA